MLLDNFLICGYFRKLFLCVLERLSFDLYILMASPGQRKGACGHIMVSFDTHSRCARCRDKGLGEDPCVSKLPCEYCDLLTPVQVIQLATPTYKLQKEKAKSKETLVDPASVMVVAQVDSQDMEPSVSTHEPSFDLSLPQSSFRKDLQELDEKWSVRMACLEAPLTLGHRPASLPSFSQVKASVAHKAPAGSISQTPFLLTSVPSGQTAPASGPDRTQTSTSSVDMIPPLENLYQEPDPEPVFAGPASSGLVSASYDQCVEALPVSARNISPPNQFEEGELSELQDQPDQDNNDGDY